MSGYTHGLTADHSLDPHAKAYVRWTKRNTGEPTCGPDGVLARAGESARRRRQRSGPEGACKALNKLTRDPVAAAR